MRVLFVHPGPLLYTKVFLRLEPLGLELVAAAARRAGHTVRLIDLQVDTHKAYHRAIADWRPDAVAFSCNYLANVPEIVDLAKATKAALPRCFIGVGGHSASFVARAILDHGEGAVDCVLKGEGEASIAALLGAAGHDRAALVTVPGAVTADGDGPPPRFVHNLDDLRPARDLLPHRRSYFIGTLDPAAARLSPGRASFRIPAALCEIQRRAGAARGRARRDCARLLHGDAAALRADLCVSADRRLDACDIAGRGAPGQP